jgi:hypothetical protein
MVRLCHLCLAKNINDCAITVIFLNVAIWELHASVSIAVDLLDSAVWEFDFTFSVDERSSDFAVRSFVLLYEVGACVPEVSVAHADHKSCDIA